ncbi:MAG TPA: HPF/RaiA family ribosome-associated protein [Gemmatimonadales bacterium]|nr:HPF/RaiA family ribosome-associated protein [Gemmatimonadales bacterium]
MATDLPGARAVPVRLAVRHAGLSPAAEAGIRRRAAHLARYFDRILACHVTVDVPQRRRRSDTLHRRVRLEVRVPGHALVVDRQPAAELATALDAAFHAMRRQLQDYVRRMREVGPPQAASPTGTVVEIYPLAGYGFLQAEDGEPVYFDRASVLHSAFERLAVGSEVHYAEELGERGRQATTVALGSSRRQTGAGVAAE